MLAKTAYTSALRKPPFRSPECLEYRERISILFAHLTIKVAKYINLYQEYTDFSFQHYNNDKFFTHC